METNSCESNKKLTRNSGSLSKQVFNLNVSLESALNDQPVGRRNMNKRKREQTNEDEEQMPSAVFDNYKSLHQTPKCFLSPDKQCEVSRNLLKEFSSSPKTYKKKARSLEKKSMRAASRSLRMTRSLTKLLSCEYLPNIPKESSPLLDKTVKWITPQNILLPSPIRSDSTTMSQFQLCGVLNDSNKSMANTKNDLNKTQNNNNLNIPRSSSMVSNQLEVPPAVVNVQDSEKNIRGEFYFGENNILETHSDMRILKQIIEDNTATQRADLEQSSIKSAPAKKDVDINKRETALSVEQIKDNCIIKDENLAYNNINNMQDRNVKKDDSCYSYLTRSRSRAHQDKKKSDIQDNSKNGNLQSSILKLKPKSFKTKTVKSKKIQNKQGRKLLKNSSLFNETVKQIKGKDAKYSLSELTNLDIILDVLDNTVQEINKEEEEKTNEEMLQLIQQQFQHSIEKMNEKLKNLKKERKQIVKFSKEIKDLATNLDLIIKQKMSLRSDLFKMSKKINKLRNANDFTLSDFRNYLRNSIS